MNINDMTYGQLREIASAFAKISAIEGASQPASVSGLGRPVIVRSRDAGVQFGYLDRYDGSTVYLKNARQMWSWTAASGGTLLDCATRGVKAGKFSGIADAVIVIGACAIIDCTADAVRTLESAKWG